MAARGSHLPDMIKASSEPRLSRPVFSHRKECPVGRLYETRLEPDYAARADQVRVASGQAGQAPVRTGGALFAPTIVTINGGRWSTEARPRHTGLSPPSHSLRDREVDESPVQQPNRVFRRGRAEVHVALRRAQIRVAGQFLNRASRSAPHGQMRTERMAQHVYACQGRSGYALGSPDRHDDPIPASRSQAGSASRCGAFFPSARRHLQFELLQPVGDQGDVRDDRRREDLHRLDREEPLAVRGEVPEGEFTWVEHEKGPGAAQARR